jgi:hypothetical protein
MFVTLSQIPWLELESGYRVSTKEVESLLQMIRSEESKHQFYAYERLEALMLNQGYIYDICCFIIPFLSKALLADRQYSAIYIYDLFIEICSSQASYDKFICFERNSNENIVIPAKKKDSGQYKVPIQIACRSLILEGFYTYYDEAVNNYRQSRFKAIELISMFDEHYVTSLTALQHIRTHLTNDTEKSKLDIFMSELNMNSGLSS